LETVRTQIDNYIEYTSVIDYLILIEAIAFVYFELTVTDEEVSAFFELIYQITSNMNNYNYTTTRGDIDTSAVINRIKTMNKLGKITASVFIKLLNSLLENKESHFNLLRNIKSGGIIYNSPGFLKMIHIFLNIDESYHLDTNLEFNVNELKFNNLIMVNSHESIRLNLCKSYILRLLTKLTDRLYKLGILLSLKSFETYIRSLCQELIVQFGKTYETTILPEEKSHNTEEEKIVIEYLINIIDFFITTLGTNVSLSIFTENTKE
jgi:hypothetical protein